MSSFLSSFTRLSFNKNKRLRHSKNYSMNNIFNSKNTFLLENKEPKKSTIAASIQSLVSKEVIKKNGNYQQVESLKRNYLIESPTFGSKGIQGPSILRHYLSNANKTIEPCENLRKLESDKFYRSINKDQNSNNQSLKKEIIDLLYPLKSPRNSITSNLLHSHLVDAKYDSVSKGGKSFFTTYKKNQKEIVSNLSKINNHIEVKKNVKLKPPQKKDNVVIEQFKKEIGRSITNRLSPCLRPSKSHSHYQRIRYCFESDKDREIRAYEEEFKH